jgi:hypothetical protein
MALRDVTSVACRRCPEPSFAVDSSGVGFGRSAASFIDRHHQTGPAPMAGLFSEQPTTRRTV